MVTKARRETRMATLCLRVIKQVIANAMTPQKDLTSHAYQINNTNINHTFVNEKMNDPLSINVWEPLLNAPMHTMH